MSGGATDGSRGLSSTVVAIVVALAVVVGGSVAAATGLVTLGVVGVAMGWDESSSQDAAPAPSRSAAPQALAASAAPSAVATPTPSAVPSSSTPTPTPSPTASPKPSPTAKPKAAAPALLAVVGVVDGDTIKVRVGGVTERVRVIGIDTPELKGGECYAQQASSRMQSLVQSKSVRLVRDRSQDDRDRYGRLLRHVQLADGRQVARILIAGGYGEEYTYDRAYSGQAAYRAAEASAREADKGIWSSGCLTPPPSAPSGACLIKGNIASDGEKIYHVPGQQYYDVTKIDESKGERWFCSESQAVDAGWRRSKR